ncbi:MAG: 50S ribosomal protein L21 [Rhodobacteraceae bacterium]|nr:50S ribosomal protein L21 [Paracoccaceae bacterium]
MYAVIETGGKQYRVELGSELHVELTGATPGSEISFDRILLVRTDTTTEIGTPVVAGAKVTATVLGQERGPKTISFKYRPKARSRITKGHRQELHLIKVTETRIAAKPTLDSLKDELTTEIQQNTIDSYLKSLESSAKIEKPGEGLDPKLIRDATLFAQ